MLFARHVDLGLTMRVGPNVIGGNDVIRQGKAKTGMAEELTLRIKEGAIPIISDVPGFRAYYVIYAPDDTVTAISIFDDYAGAEEFNKRALAWIEQSLAPLLIGPATAVAGPVIVHTLA